MPVTGTDSLETVARNSRATLPSWEMTSTWATPAPMGTTFWLSALMETALDSSTVRRW
jgi:hypothetical protein